MNGQRYIKLRWLLSVIVTLVVLWLFFRELSFQDVGNVLKNINLSWFSLAAGAYVVSTIIRAQRLRYVGFKNEPLKSLTKITFLQFFYSNLLPWRTGEFSFFYLVKRNSSQPVAVAASSLLITRLFDFIAVVIILIISLLLLFPELVRTGDPLLLSALGVLILLLVLLAFTLFGRRVFTRSAKVLVRFFRIKQEFLDNHIIPRWQRFGEELNQVRRKLSALLINSLIAWFLIGLMTWGMAESIGLAIDIPSSIFLTVFPPFAVLIPLPTFANFGTIEAGWAFGLSFLGYSAATALEIGLFLHVLSIILYLLGALIGTSIDIENNDPKDQLDVSRIGSK